MPFESAGRPSITNTGRTIRRLVAGLPGRSELGIPDRIAHNTQKKNAEASKRASRI
jgi:hypothetical protein